MTELPPLPFQARRDIILTRLAGGSMVLPAAPVQFMGGDSEYRYRPDSELLYATGWTAPSCVAVLRGFADEDRFALFVPERDAKAELWTGPRADLEQVKERFGADAVHPLRELAERGPGLLAGGDTIHYRLGASPGATGWCGRRCGEGACGGRGGGPERMWWRIRGPCWTGCGCARTRPRSRA